MSSHRPAPLPDPGVSVDAVPGPSTFVCPSCGNRSPGTFCTNCGERKLGSEERSLLHYLDGAVNFFTHFDSKGYRSLWCLISRPGFLSAEQLRGSRVRYAKPLFLFVSINVFYYFSIAFIGASTFSTPLSVQLTMNDYYPAFAARSVEHRQHATSLGAAAFAARYDEKAAVLSKTLVFLFIPIFALLFHALFFARKRYFVEHLVIATHLWSFILLLLAVVVPVIAFAIVWLQPAPSAAAALVANDAAVSVFLQVCLAVYLTFMLRRVYRASNAYCMTVAALIASSFFHIVWLYRFLLFVIMLRAV